MSRPPIHRRTPSPRGELGPDHDQARYFGPDFAELVALAERLGRERHGIEIPGKGRGLARTLMEIPALLAHILGEHQSLYARESFIGTARLPISRVRHARKLAYAPDGGVAATGLAAFMAKPGLAGELPKGFALQSTAKGDVKAQTYETLTVIGIDEAWNAMRLEDSMMPTPVQISPAGVLELPLTRRHGLERGEIVVVEGEGHAGVFKVADPCKGAIPPRIVLSQVGGTKNEDWRKPVAGATAPINPGFRLHVRPQVESRLFGWNANAALYPPGDVSKPTTYSTSAPGEVHYGYEQPTVVDGYELFLAEAIKSPEIGAIVALLRPNGGKVMKIMKVNEHMVVFKRGERIRIPATSPGSPTAPATGSATGSGGASPSALVSVVSSGPGSTFINPNMNAAKIPEETILTITTPTKVEIIESSLSERVAALTLEDFPTATSPTGDPKKWDKFPLDGMLLTGWQETIDVEPKVSNVAPFVDEPIRLVESLDAENEGMRPVDLSGMRPGRTLILRNTRTDAAIEAGIVLLTPPMKAGEAWTVELSAVGGMPSGWSKGEVEILGNVVPVSHGEAKTETLGGSDGVTPHQSFDLKGTPVTRVRGALGSVMTLELRVAGVLWDIAQDFHDADTAARIARTQTDADGHVSVHFGGEGRGAVPPSGTRHLEASYRIGLGTVGNIEPGRLSRIKKASPLLDRVTNPLAISGGSDPAGADDIALQATRPVRIFDRAVSVADHADLALLFEGVARASARWLDRGGIEVVAADAEGNGIADPKAFRAFMNKRRDTGVPLILLAPQKVPVAVSLRVERDRAWLAETVRLAVEQALIGSGEDPGLFSFAGRGLSEPQSLSGVYACVLGVPGVTGVEATRFDIAPGKEVTDILHATDRQWLSLRPADLDIDLIEPGLLMADTGGGA